MSNRTPFRALAPAPVLGPVPTVTPALAPALAPAPAPAPRQANLGRAYPYAVVAVEVGADTVRIAVLLGGRLGKVTNRRTDELLAGTPGGTDLIAGIAHAVRTIVPAGETVDLVGVALDAHVDDRGRVGRAHPAGIPAGTDLRGRLEEALGAPVLVDGAAGLAALGEARQGAAKGCRDVVYLGLDRTISIGIVSDRRIIRGAHGAAGSLGRILLPAHRGVSGRDEEARVPRIGAGMSDAPTGYARLDEVAGVAGLERIFTDGSRPLELRPEISDRRGKAAARQAIEGWALAISDIAALYDPEAIVLGGAVMTAAPGLVPALQHRVDDLFPAVAGIPAPSLRLGRLGPRAALIGASVAARQALTTGRIRRPARPIDLEPLREAGREPLGKRSTPRALREAS